MDQVTPVPAVTEAGLVKKYRKFMKDNGFSDDEDTSGASSGPEESGSGPAVAA